MDRRILGLIGAAAALCGVALASVFGSAGELFSGDGATAPVSAVTAAEDGDGGSSSERQRRGLGQALKAWVQKLPFALKAGVLLPLMLAGRTLLALLGVLSGAAQTLLGPVFAFAAAFLLRFGILLLLFWLLWRAAHPNGRFRDFIKKGNLICIAAGALLLTAADRLLPKLWPDYELLCACLSAALELAVIILLWYKVLRMDGGLGFRVRRLLLTRRGISIGLCVAGAVLLRLWLTFETKDTFLDFLPAALPYCFIAVFVLSVIAGLRKRWHCRPAAA